MAFVCPNGPAKLFLFHKAVVNILWSIQAGSRSDDCDLRTQVFCPAFLKVSPHLTSASNASAPNGHLYSLSFLQNVPRSGVSRRGSPSVRASFLQATFQALVAQFNPGAPAFAVFDFTETTSDGRQIGKLILIKWYAAREAPTIACAPNLLSARGGIGESCVYSRMDDLLYEPHRGCSPVLCSPHFVSWILSVAHRQTLTLCLSQSCHALAWLLRFDLWFGMSSCTSHPLRRFSWPLAVLTLASAQVPG